MTTSSILAKIRAAARHGLDVLIGATREALVDLRHRASLWQSSRSRRRVLPLITRSGDLITVASGSRRVPQSDPPTTVVVRCGLTTQFTLVETTRAFGVLATVRLDGIDTSLLVADGLRPSEAAWTLRRVGALMQGASASERADGDGGWFWRVAAVGVLLIAAVWLWPSSEAKETAPAAAMLDPTFVPPPPEFSDLPIPGISAPHGATAGMQAPAVDAFGLSGGEGDAGLVPTGPAGPQPLAGCDPGMSFEVR